MADTAGTLNRAVGSQSRDTMIMSLAGAALLALFGVIVALLPFDAAPDVTRIPLLFP
jgi:hypothetical protein